MTDEFYTPTDPGEIDDVEGVIEEIVSGWYLDGPLDAEGFIDRLDGTLLVDGPGAGKRLDLGDQMDSPTVLRALKIARRVKKESA